MLPIQCEAQVSTFLTSSQVVATLLVYRPHFPKRHKRPLTLISAVKDKVQTVAKQQTVPNLGREAAAAMLGAALEDILASGGRRD